MKKVVELKYQFLFNRKSNVERLMLHTRVPISMSQLEHRLQPGDLVTFNNRRVLHARKSFDLNDGVRHLKVLVLFTFLLIMIMIFLIYMA